jgi:hypothetical protein
MLGEWVKEIDNSIASVGVNFGASVSYTPKLGGMC